MDLSDLDGDLPLAVSTTTQILWQTQDWEHGSLGNPAWPSGGGDSVGFPTMVKNTHGLNQDGKYYLYYAHHDPMSGIGCAVANSITGPYTKISPTDSKVLTVPNYNPSGPNQSDPSHYSSPCVIWNEDEQLWFLYFHYYNHYWGGAGEPPGEHWSQNNPGLGQQMTALATTADLASHNWTVWTNPVWSPVSVWDIVPVLQTTDELWMESQSSYHAIQRLPNGQWLAFLRGTSDLGAPTVGFGTSTNGRDWTYFPENPVIASGKAWTVATSEYRPKFIGYLGNDEYMVAWAEHSNPNIIYSKTTDFKTFQRDARGYAAWGVGDDGIVSAWREGDRLYLFTGKNVCEMVLPLLVYVPPPGSTMIFGAIGDDGSGPPGAFDGSITPTASQTVGGVRTPDRAINGSGIVHTGGSAADPNNYAHAFGTNAFGDTYNFLADLNPVEGNWFKVDLGQTYELQDAFFFNFNPDASEGGLNNEDRGVATANIWYLDAAADPNANNDGNDSAFIPTGWTQLGTTSNFTIAPTGDANQTVPDVITFGGVNARFVALDMLTNHGDGGFIGFGEIQFFAVPIPDPPIDLVVIEDTLGATFDSVSNATYRLQSTPDLVSSNFTDTGAIAIGNGAAIIMFDPTGPSTSKNYRVVPD